MTELELFTDILDEALEALKTEPVTAVLHRYPDHAKTLAPLLTAAEKLGEWQTAVSTTRSSDWQTADRAHFLDQINQLPLVPVSPGPLLRLKGWLTQTRTALRNQNVYKEHKPMNVLFARAIATAIVIFGLGGGTVALANDSLPDTPLYPVKLMLEETRLNLAEDPVEQANLQTELAQVRLEEMIQLAFAGEPVSNALLVRLETHLQTALHQAAQTDDTELVGLLTQMQTMLQNEQQTRTQLGEPVQAMLGEAQQIMDQYQEQAQAGLEDPPKFRWRQAQDGDWEPAGNGIQNGQDEDTNDSGQNGPSDGAGDGACLSGECEPIGDANQFGQSDANNGQNGNGDFDGDGVCDNGDCVPVGDENQFGQDDNNTGQNGAGDLDGDGVCDNGDCVPAGDENQFGQGNTNTGQNGDDDFDGDGVCDNNCTPVGDGPQPNQDHSNGNGHGNGS